MNKDELFNDFIKVLIFGEGQMIAAEPLKKVFNAWKRKFLVTPSLKYEEMLDVLSKRAGVVRADTQLTGVGLRAKEIKELDVKKYLMR
jgi:hypothetical protein